MKEKYNNIYMYLYMIYLSLFLFSVSCVLSSCKKVNSDLDVAGGKVISDSDYPSVVRLRSGGGGTCTGSIISSNTILTAAHCTSNSGKDHYALKTGTNNFIKAKAVKANTKYNWPKNGNSVDEKMVSKNDIAVWVFEEDMFKDVKDKLQISDFKPQVLDVGRMVGWGCHLAVQERLVNNTKVKDVGCNKNNSLEKRTGTNKVMFVPDDLSYVKLYSDTSLIDNPLKQEQSTTGEGVLVTFGDSGGPLLSEAQPTKIIGVASYIDTPWNSLCNDTSSITDYEDKMGCEYLTSAYINPATSYNMPVLQEMVDNQGAIIPGIQVGVGVVEFDGKIKVLYKEGNNSFNENVQEHKVIDKFNNTSYSSVSSLKQAWRNVDFYERSKASWSFEN